MNLAELYDATKQAINFVIEVAQKLAEFKDSVPIFTENKEAIKELAKNGDGALKGLAIALSILLVIDAATSNSIIKKIWKKINQLVLLHNKEKRFEIKRNNKNRL